MKGYHGESCSEALRNSMEPNRPVAFSELFKRVRIKGNWSDDTIWQDTIAHVVNLTPARFHWKSTKPFLLLHEDGTFEIYDSQKHPRIKE